MKIAKLEATHNNSAVEKWVSTEAMRILLQLYLVIGSESILPYNLWVDVGMNNGAKKKVVDFVYNYDKEPKRNNG